MNCARAFRRVETRWKRAVGGVVLATLSSAAGGDWPQYRGPNHDGISADRLNKNWTGAVTNPVWRVRCTNGLSSLTVSGGRVFTQIRRNLGGVDKEVCVSLNATNGAELWARTVDDANYPDTGVGTDDGPRSTPVVDGGSVYVLTSYLKLYRLNATNGEVTWSTNLLAGYSGSVIDWQNAASPVVDGGLIFLNANAGSARLLALRTGDGSLAWRSQNEAMTHSSPVLATIHGLRQLIFATQSGLVSLNPQTGARLWKFNYPFSYSTSVGVSPVVHEDMVFVSGAHSYGMGSVALRANFINSTWTTTQLWFTTSRASHWTTPVAYQGFLYGQFGIQSYDSDKAQLKCVDLRTGAEKWSTNDFGRAGTVLVGDHLVVLTERGDLVLVRPNTNTYAQVARFQAIPYYHGTTNKCWNVPAVSDGKVYLRSTAYAAAFDFSVPDLKLDAPRRTPANTFELAVRTADGTPVNTNRLAGLEVRASTNPALSLAQWTRLANALVLTNGVVRITNVDGSISPQFFIVREPQ